MIDREGRLLITNKRVLLIDGGTLAVPHDKILDLDVDLHENLIQITKDGRANPILITFPGAWRAGAIIGRLTGINLGLEQ